MKSSLRNYIGRNLPTPRIGQQNLNCARRVWISSRIAEVIFGKRAAENLYGSSMP